jgi:hypothetical protein
MSVHDNVGLYKEHVGADQRLMVMRSFVYDQARLSLAMYLSLYLDNLDETYFNWVTRARC